MIQIFWHKLNHLWGYFRVGRTLFIDIGRIEIIVKW
jgi:hypothetical protein